MYLNSFTQAVVLTAECRVAWSVGDRRRAISLEVAALIPELSEGCTGGSDQGDGEGGGKKGSHPGSTLEGKPRRFASISDVGEGGDT